MTDELKQAIELLRHGAPKINKAADDATEAVRAAEKLLDDCGAGVSVAVPVSNLPGNDEHTMRYLELGYERHEGKHRIVVINELGAIRDDGFGDYEYSRAIEREATPWLASPRSDKLATFPKLPDLLARIATAVQDQLKDVEAATKASRTLLDAMNE